MLSFSTDETEKNLRGKLGGKKLVVWWFDVTNKILNSLSIFAVNLGTVNSRFKKLRFKKESRFKIVATTDFSVHKLFDLRKIFQCLMFDLRKKIFRNVKKIGRFLTILEQFLLKIQILGLI